MKPYWRGKTAKGFPGGARMGDVLEHRDAHYLFVGPGEDDWAAYWHEDKNWRDDFDARKAELDSIVKQAEGSVQVVQGSIVLGATNMIPDKLMNQLYRFMTDHRITYNTMPELLTKTMDTYTPPGYKWIEANHDWTLERVDPDLFGNEVLEALKDVAEAYNVKYSVKAKGKNTHVVIPIVVGGKDYDMDLKVGDDTKSLNIWYLSVEAGNAQMKRVFDIASFVEFMSQYFEQIGLKPIRRVKSRPKKPDRVLKSRPKDEPEPEPEPEEET